MYRRQIELIGKENQEKLAQKSVLIVGAGGLGNIIASTISCIGLKKIYIVDFDKVEIHNIHRQFQFSKSDIGKFKAEVLANKLSRCKELEYYVNKFDKKFIENFKKGVLEKSSDFLGCDIIFDATDNFQTRALIDEFARSLDIPWVYASVDEWYGQVGLFKEVSFDFFEMKEVDSKGQLPPMVNLVGSIASMVGIKALIGQMKEILYYIDFKNDLEVKKFSF